MIQTNDKLEFQDRMELTKPPPNNQWDTPEMPARTMSRRERTSLRNRGMSPCDIAFLEVMVSDGRGLFPLDRKTVEDLADRAGYSRVSGHRAMRNLIDAGYISKTRRVIRHFDGSFLRESGNAVLQAIQNHPKCNKTGLDGIYNLHRTTGYASATISTDLAQLKRLRVIADFYILRYSPESALDKSQECDMME